MISHLSFNANQPKHVADVISELIGAVVKPFKPVPGAFIAFTDDDISTLIEVYPKSVILKPNGNHKYKVDHIENPEIYSPCHFLIECIKSKEEVLNIAQRESWHAIKNRRADLFNIIEFWVENVFMIELLFPEDKAEALAALRSDAFTPSL